MKHIKICFCLIVFFLSFTRATGQLDEYAGVGDRFREALKRLPLKKSVVWKRKRSPIAR